MDTLEDEAIMRLPVVKELTGHSRSTIYEKMKRREFPRPVQLSKRSVGWRVKDVRAYLKNLPPAVNLSSSKN